MANDGMLLTGGATLLAALSFLATAVEARPRPGTSDRRWSIFAFFAITAVFLTLAGTRQFFAYSGRYDIDRLLFFALVIPAAFSALPLIHLATSLDGRLRPWFVVAPFAAASMVGLLFVFKEGLVGPEVTWWGTEYKLASLVSRLLILLAIALPAVASTAITIRAGHRMGPSGRRLRIVGWTIAVYYIVFTIDAFALWEGLLVFERLAIAVAARVAYRAYQAPAPGP
jgi:hypothetical protein